VRVRVSLATIIAISSQLKESSDGFDFEAETVQSDSKITNKGLTPNLLYYYNRK
jgi:hypothetical protein